MEKTKPILYGVADYAELRKANAWFIDRTAKIRDLEATRYAMFLRPRRFGKSLLVSLLEYYYDVAFADRFDELFGGTDIGSNPTEERGGYLALYFDFSAVSKDTGRVQDDFNAYAGLCCDTFARKYAGILPVDMSDRILAASNVAMKLNEIFLGMRDGERKLIKEWQLSGTGCQPVPANDRAGHPTNGTVTLHRLVLVFHGGECVLGEEV